MSRALLLAALVVADVTPKGDLFRAESAKLVGALQVGKAPIASFTFSRDARRLLVLSIDGKLTLWDVGGRKEIREAPGFYYSSRILMSADGTRALGPSVDRRSVRLVDLERGTELQVFQDAQPAYLQSYALSPDGRRVALMQKDQSVRIWDATSREEVRTLIEPASSKCGAMAWSPDGKLLAIHGWDSTVRILDVATGETAGSFAAMGQTPLYLNWSPDSAMLALVTQEAKARLFNRAGKEIKTLDEVLTGSRVLAFSADGGLLAAADVAGRVRIWNTRTWKRLNDLETGHVRHLAFSPDGRVLAMSSVDGVVRMWGPAGSWAGSGKVTPPRPGAPGYLGITGEMGEAGGGGALVTSVSDGTPAQQAGLQAGDRITKIGDSATDTFEALRGVVMSLREGDEIEVVYKRDGAEKKVKLKLGARPPE